MAHERSVICGLLHCQCDLDKMICQWFTTYFLGINIQLFPEDPDPEIPWSLDSKGISTIKQRGCSGVICMVHTKKEGFAQRLFDDYKGGFREAVGCREARRRNML